MLRSLENGYNEISSRMQNAVNGWNPIFEEMKQYTVRTQLGMQTFEKNQNHTATRILNYKKIGSVTVATFI